MDNVIYFRSQEQAEATARVLTRRKGRKVTADPVNTYGGYIWLIHCEGALLRESGAFLHNIEAPANLTPYPVEEQPMRSADSMSEAIAMSSPSGKMSKAAKERARKRWLEKYGTRPAELKPPTNDEIAAGKRRNAQMLLDLAARGMKPRAYKRQAEKLLAEAAELEAASSV